MDNFMYFISSNGFIKVAFFVYLALFLICVIIATIKSANLGMWIMIGATAIIQLLTLNSIPTSSLEKEHIAILINQNFKTQEEKEFAKSYSNIFNENSYGIRKCLESNYESDFCKQYLKMQIDKIKQSHKQVLLAEEKEKMMKNNLLKIKG